MSNKRLNSRQLKDMRQSYMEYVPVTVIAEKYNVARSTVMHHVNKGWEEQRGLRRAELYRNLTDSKQVDFNQITTNTITVLKKSLANLASRNDAPTLKEALDASKILDILDKITRLDEGKPTDIIGNNDRPIEIIELKKRIALDPFAIEEETVIHNPKEVEDDANN